MGDNAVIINNKAHGHFRLEEQDDELMVTKELRFQWRLGADGRVSSITDLRTGQAVQLFG